MNAIIEFTNRLLGKSSPDEYPDIFKFNGGVHPPENKETSIGQPIGQLAMPSKLTLPLRQHVGNLPKLRVDVGDIVLKGQMLAEAEGNVSAAIHAPTSGRIAAISEEVIPHPSGLTDQCITLIPDGNDTWVNKTATDWENTPKPELVAKLRDSGIVGLGGATFPTHIKLRSDGRSNIHTLVINAAECEPYITCDDMLMRERANEIIEGIKIVRHLLGAETCYVGIEDNKPTAKAVMTKAAAEHGVTIKSVPTLYPSGDGRRLIHLLLGIEIPNNKRSTDVGVQVFNVATVLAIYRYFKYGEPSISRIVTMTGAVQEPRNFEVLFGTPLSNLVQAGGGAHKETTHFVMGGPMMGFDLPLADVPITKAANCIIAATPTIFEAPAPEMPCIRCTRCADACPVNLQPQELFWFSKSDNFEKARDYNLFDCIECGCCTYVCPSNIPLVQHYRYAKSEIITADKAKEAADLARERNDFRIARIEREKEERAQKHAERAAAAKARKEADKLKAATSNTSSNDSATDADKARKQDAIAAAVARAKAKKAETADAPKNTENVSANVAAEIKAIDTAREKAGIATAPPVTEAPPANNLSPEETKKAKIAAAIAKARANKLAAEEAKSIAPKETNQAAAPAPTAQAPSTEAAKPKDDKQAKIEAAIARARANKLAADQAKGIAPTSQPVAAKAPEPVAEKPSVPLTDKQIKVNAALERARANKRAADEAKKKK
jgi:electron transport complex protein RnfC